MGIFADIGATVGVQKMKNGGVAKLSISQIVNLLINLTDAKKNLPEDRYLMVYATYRGMRECKIKLPMNMDAYIDMAIKIIKEFDLIAPYEKYGGNAEVESAFLMEDILGKNHEKIRKLRREIADMKEELKERDAADAKNEKIYKESYTDEQLAQMVSRGQFPASRVKEYVEARNSLASFVRNAPAIREVFAGMIEELESELSELEGVSDEAFK